MSLSDSHTLSVEQQLALDYVKQGKNVFITGAGGMGKSYLLTHVIEFLQEKYGRTRVAITSTTGISAIPIHGCTIHSFTKLRLDFSNASLEELLYKIKYMKILREPWKNVDAIVLEEVSMLSCDLFIKIDYLARFARKVYNKPFGGLLVILNGDFLQLPPIIKHGTPAKFSPPEPKKEFEPFFAESTQTKKRDARGQLKSTSSFSSKEAYNKKLTAVKNFIDKLVTVKGFPCIPPHSARTAKFAFEAPNWEAVVDQCVELTVPFRQTDSAFINMLNRVRRGISTDEDKALLQSRLGALLPEDDGIRATVLKARNDAVDAHNKSELAKLPHKEMVYTAKVQEIRSQSRLTDFGIITERSSRHTEALQKQDKQRVATMKNMLVKNCQAPERLVLKEETQVMLLANLNVTRGLANGSRGVVVGFTEPGERFRDYDQFWEPKKKESDFDKGRMKVTVGSPIVRFAVGLTFPVDVCTWSVMDHKTDTEIQYKQVPLKIAYALSIHKSQGQTLDRAEIALGARIFEDNQAYVALSRVRSLEGLRLTEWDPRALRTNQKVLQFYESLRT